MAANLIVLDDKESLDNGISVLTTAPLSGIVHK